MKSLHVSRGQLNRHNFSFSGKCFSEDKEEHDYSYKGDERPDRRNGVSKGVGIWVVRISSWHACKAKEMLWEEG